MYALSEECLERDQFGRGCFGSGVAFVGEERFEAGGEGEGAEWKSRVGEEEKTV